MFVDPPLVSIWIRVQRYDGQKFLNGNKIHIFFRPPGRKIKLQEKPAALKGVHPALKKQ